jgi:hypothetical protein
MVTPKILTRKCTECRDGMMEGELQVIPKIFLKSLTHFDKSGYSSVVPK